MEETMKKKKIAVVCGALSIGGAENMICELICNLDPEKYDLVLYCLGSPQNTYLERKIAQMGIQTVFCSLSGKVTPAKLYRFSRLLSQFHPDVIHTHISGAIYALPYILIHPVKHIHTLHTAPDKEFSRPVRKLLVQLYKSGKSTLVTVSEENRELAQKAYHLRKTEVECINNGVDTDRYYQKKHHDFTFINVGRQDQNKNQKIIIEAFQDLIQDYPEIRLILVGDGNQHENLMTEVSRLHLDQSVHFPGLVSNTEDYLAEADVYIQSSHVEGLPLSVIEAMAASLPVISTRVGGIPDVIQDNGILIEDNCVEELRQAMQKMIDHRELCKAMGSRSKTLSEKYSSKYMAASYGSLYDRKE